MNTKNHHEFTLWIYSEECDEEKVPGITFDEGTSFDKILLTMLQLDHLGLYCTLTCNTWTVFQNDESEDDKID